MNERKMITVSAGGFEWLVQDDTDGEKVLDLITSQDGWEAGLTMHVEIDDEGAAGTWWDVAAYSSDGEHHYTDASDTFEGAFALCLEMIASIQKP